MPKTKSNLTGWAFAGSLAVAVYRPSWVPFMVCTYVVVTGIFYVAITHLWKKAWREGKVDLTPKKES